MPSEGPLASLTGYPGRGLVLFRAGGEGFGWLYFLTGRSPSSRARRFEVHDHALSVVPTDTRAEADQLRHYTCAFQLAERGPVVVGNGDHVQQIARAIEGGDSPADAIEPLLPEPDPPIDTPRIAAVVDRDQAWLLSVADLHDHIERRADTIDLRQGDAMVLHTYGGTPEAPVGATPRFRSPISSPREVPDLIWGALHPDYRVALACGSARSAQPTCLRP
jgi:IMP cyclohydrolase